MAGEWLLKRLTDNNLPNIAEDVQAYLSPVTSHDLEEAAQRKYGLFSANFLRASIGCLENSDVGLISAIHTTYHCFQQMRSKVQLSQPLFLVQVLYHIFVKLSDKENLEDCVSVALYVLEEVGDSGESDKTVSNIITRVYHTLWNAAAKVETQAGSAAVAFRARHVALKFIALQKRAVDVFTQKILISLIRYGQVISRCKVSDGCGEGEELLTSVCDDLCNLVTDQYTQSHSSIVLIRLHQFKELWGRGSIIKAGEAVDSLLHLPTWCKLASPHSYVSLSLCKACLSLSHVKQHLQDKTLINSAESVLTGFSEVLHEYQNVPSKCSTDDELSEDIKAFSILLAASFTGEARTLLNTTCQTSEEGLDVLCEIVSILKCQSRFHVQFCYSEELSKVQKSWAWNLQPNKTLTTMYLLQLQLLHILLHKRYANGASLLSEAIKVIQDLQDHLKRISVKGKQEKSAHDLGTVAQKLGNVCYINEDDERATVFYKVACRYLTEWCEEDPAKRKASIQEVYLWKCYDSLAECYRRSGKHREAMETVIECVLVDRSHLMSAAKIWVRAKKDLLKRDQISQETLNKSLMESVLEKGIDLDMTEKRELLEKELKVYRTYRSVCSLHEAELKCHQDLLQLTSDKLEKAVLLVEETKLLWLHPALSDQRCCFSCAKEAVQLLSGQKSNTPLVATTSAEAYLWLYITSMKQFRERVKTPAPNFFCPKPCEDSDSGEDKPVVKTKFKCAYVTVPAEQSMTSLLDRALLLWTRCVADNHLSEELDYTAITQSLNLCAVIYYSIGKTLKGLECLQLVKKMSSAVSPGQLSQTVDCLFRLWCEIDHPTMVSQLLQDWNCPQDMTFCLRKAQHALRLGELDECGELATDLLEKVQAVQPRTRESCLLEGAALRLLSRLTAVTRGVAEKRLGVRACSSHLAKESVRCHTSVLHHLMGKDLNEPMAPKGAQPVDMWLVVTETLLSLLHLGRVNLLTGYARRATCYLEEGLALAQALAIPRWCVNFLTELARLNSVSGCVEDANMYLKQAREVLYTNEEFVLYKEREEQSCGNMTAGTFDTSQISADVPGDCFGFASPMLEGGDQGELMIKAPKARGVSEDCDLLSAELSVPGQPDPVNHPAECVCESCSDLTSHRLYIDYLLTLSEHCLSNGAARKAVDKLFAARELLSKLATKMPALVRSLPHETSEKLHERMQNATHPLVWLNILHGKTSCCLAKAYLVSGEKTLSVKAANDGQAWVTGCSQGVSDIVHLQAQLWLCKAQSRLRLPSLTHLKTENLEEPVVTTPQQSTLDDSQSKLTAFSLVMNLEKLILEDEEEQHQEEKNKAKAKLQPKRTAMSGRSKKTVICVSDSDEDREDVKKDLVKTRKGKKAHTMLPKSGKVTVEESEVEDDSNVPAKDISSDICEQLSNLSIKSGKSKNVKSKTDEACEGKDEHVPENSIKKSGRTRKAKNETKAVSNADTGNIQPKLTRRKAKPVVEVPETFEMKKCQTRQKKSVIPVKVPVPELSPESVFDFDTCDENVPVKGKSAIRASKKNNTPAKSKVSKTTRIRRPKTGSEIEVGRAVQEDLWPHDRECDLAVIAVCEDDDDARLTPPSVIDSVVEIGEDLSQSTPLSLKHLDLSNTLLPITLDLDTSIELVRVGTDDEESGKSRTTRCRGGRKKSVKAKEETEITRASRVAKYKQQPVKKSKPKALGKAYSSDQLHSERSAIKTETAVLPVSEIPELKEALRLISPFPPMSLYRDICHCLALHYIQQSPVLAASYLAESMAVTLRHRAQCNQAAQQKQLLKAGKSVEEIPVDCRLEFGHTGIMANLECLPKDWSVCMLSVVQQGSDDSELIATRLQNGAEPVVKRIISFNSDQMQGVLAQFTEIMEGSQKAMKISNKTEWWKIRKGLDADLQEVLLRLENDCLRGWKVLLVGQLADEDGQEVLTNIMSSVSDQLTSPLGKVLLSSGPACTETQLSELVTELSGGLPRTSAHTDLLKEARERVEQIPSGARRRPVILILDPLLQHLPWESIPVLRGQPVCRMPSLHHLHSQLLVEQERGQSALRHGVDPKSTYYILNPENNLPATQTHFQKMFEQQAGWCGLTGVAPTKEQFTAALTDHQLLVYCGHGAGSKYLPGDDIQFLQCQATALLVGCSSGRLHVEGQLEPYGMMHNYFLAGCPCVVGNLWDVTDKDIDRLTEALLNSLLKPGEDKCLATVLAKSRGVCRLPHLIGCAPVVYGLPVKFR